MNDDTLFRDVVLCLVVVVVAIAVAMIWKGAMGYG